MQQVWMHLGYSNLQPPWFTHLADDHHLNLIFLGLILRNYVGCTLKVSLTFLLNVLTFLS
jgi:hypothetical protein